MPANTKLVFMWGLVDSKKKTIWCNSGKKKSNKVLLLKRSENISRIDIRFFLAKSWKLIKTMSLLFSGKMRESTLLNVIQSTCCGVSV